MLELLQYYCSGPLGLNVILSRCIFFAVCMGTTYWVQWDLFRTLFIYGPTAFLLLASRNLKFAVSYLLAIAHAAGHRIDWVGRFIDENGMNEAKTAFPDLVVHLLMMIHAYWLMDDYPMTAAERSALRQIQVMFTAGMVYNVWTSLVYPVTHFHFADASTFSTLSVALFLAAHVFYTTERSSLYFKMIAMSFVPVLSNLYWVRFYDQSGLNDMYINRYFEALFSVATWILPLVS